MTNQTLISIPPDQILSVNYGCVKYMDYLIDRNINACHDVAISQIKNMRDIFAAAHLQDIPADIPLQYTAILVQAMIYFLPSYEKMDKKVKPLTDEQKGAYYFRQMQEEGHWDDIENCQL